MVIKKLSNFNGVRDSLHINKILIKIYKWYILMIRYSIIKVDYKDKILKKM